MKVSSSIGRPRPGCGQVSVDTGILGAMDAFTPSIDSDLRSAATAILRSLVGREDAEFHDGQFEAIEALVAGGRRALVVQRTGWGKSAVYFVASLLLRARGAGPTLIVSPLLALMRDQVAAAARAGVRAEAINSANALDWENIAAKARQRRAGRAAGVPGTAEQPGLPRHPAARAGRAAWACW